MKVKALRYKDTKEFVHFEDYDGEPMVLTSEIPKILPKTATLEFMKQLIETNDFYEGIELDMKRVELIEFDLIESDEVGADIRNKLTPYKNLVSLIKLFLKETDAEKMKSLKKFIEKELKQSEKSVKYIAKLF